MIWLGDRDYRVRGLAQNTSPTVLKVNLRVLGKNVHGDMALHVDTLEMSSSRQRMAFSKQAAEELQSRLRTHTCPYISGSALLLRAHCPDTDSIADHIPRCGEQPYLLFGLATGVGCDEVRRGPIHVSVGSTDDGRPLGTTCPWAYPFVNGEIELTFASKAPSTA